MIRQIAHFLIHLRLHYQFLILSGGYLLAGLFVPEPNWQLFLLQFLNVHILLFGGATAYNSWWDKDTGPIGGLKSPPAMTPWMRTAAMTMQYAGLLWAWFAVGWVYAFIYALSMLLFWLYSTPLARWKGNPLLSLLAIGISTGTNSFLLGLLAAGFPNISYLELLTALGVALILLSLYPVSQIFQIDEDLNRGDQTFALAFGLKGVKLLFGIGFITGAVFISLGLYPYSPFTALLFAGVSILAYLIIGRMIHSLQGKKDEYELVMRIKFIASFSFVAFILVNLLVRFLG